MDDKRQIPTVKELAKLALSVQDACNLSGVVRTYAQVLSDLWAQPDCKGTEWVNKHPVSVMFADKIAQLTGTQELGNSETMRAYTWAHEVMRAAS